jgi:hypothetical protein
VLLSTFAAVAFLMAIVGVYGVLAFSVAQRSEEIGIRMALGATPGAVLALVMKEGAALMAAGALRAWPRPPLPPTLLYGVTATDPGTYAASSSYWPWPHRLRVSCRRAGRPCWIPWLRYVTSMLSRPKALHYAVA